MMTARGTEERKYFFTQNRDSCTKVNSISNTEAAFSHSRMQKDHDRSVTRGQDDQKMHMPRKVGHIELFTNILWSRK